MSRFLRFIGFVEAIGYFAGFIIFLVYVNLSGLNILYFVLYLVLTPTLFCICFSVANLLEENENKTARIENLEKKIRILSGEEKPEDSENSVPEKIFEIGATVVFKKDAYISNSIRKVIREGSEGKIVDIDEDVFTVAVSINGEDYQTVQNMSVFSLK